MSEKGWVNDLVTLKVIRILDSAGQFSVRLKEQVLFTLAPLGELLDI